MYLHGPPSLPTLLSVQITWASCCGIQKFHSHLHSKNCVLPQLTRLGGFSQSFELQSGHKPAESCDGDSGGGLITKLSLAAPCPVIYKLPLCAWGNKAASDTGPEKQPPRHYMMVIPPTHYMNQSVSERHPTVFSGSREISLQDHLSQHCLLSPIWSKALGTAA